MSAASTTARPATHPRSSPRPPKPTCSTWRPSRRQAPARPSWCRPARRWTLADLRGKRIGFARASSAHNLTIAALEKAGIAWNEITPVQLPPADARAAFERGALDAWTIWDPYFAVAEKGPGVRILASAKGIARQNAFFLANR